MEGGRPASPCRGRCQPPQAASVKSRGGERCGKVAQTVRQAEARKANASEPPRTCRKNWGTPKPSGVSASGAVWERPACCPDGVRHGGGASLAQPLVWNVGTCRPDD